MKKSYKHLAITDMATFIQLLKCLNSYSTDDWVLGIDKNNNGLEIRNLTTNFKIDNEATTRMLEQGGGAFAMCEMLQNASRIIKDRK